MKNIIWDGNINLNDWKEYFEEEFGDDYAERYDDDFLYRTVENLNNIYLGDERLNLDIELNNDIIIIGDFGHFNYKIVGSNVKDILDKDLFSTENICFYSDGYNVKIKADDDVFECRMLKLDEDVDNLLAKLNLGKKVSRATINKYTRSILPPVAETYGWKTLITEVVDKSSNFRPASIVKE